MDPAWSACAVRDWGAGWRAPSGPSAFDGRWSAIDRQSAHSPDHRFEPKTLRAKDAVITHHQHQVSRQKINQLIPSHNARLDHSVPTMRVLLITNELFITALGAAQLQAKNAARQRAGSSLVASSPSSATQCFVLL